MATARAKLRRKFDTRLAAAPHPEPPALAADADDTSKAVADALVEMAAPELDALGDALTESDADRLIGAASQAYNLPLFDQMAHGTETAGTIMRAALELGFERIPGLRDRFDRMVALRRTRFAHLRQPILECKVSFESPPSFTVVLTLVGKRETELLLRNKSATEL